MNESKAKFTANLYDLLSIIVSAIVIIFAVFTFGIRTSTVYGSSMIPTLVEGNKVVIQSFAYTPKQGDIVIISQPNIYDVNLVKRVIATEGQTVYIDTDTGVVVVDGKVLSEPYLTVKTKEKGDITYPVTVPKGCVFVMGDNRNYSTDSRFKAIGFINENYIAGKAMVKMDGLKFTKLGTGNE